jgi:probable rRNA maturation factor
MTQHKLTLSVQHADRRLATVISRTDIRRWVRAAQFAAAELAVRFVGEDEGRRLNRDYRGKDYATNVLTFAYNEADQHSQDDIVRADIVLCVDVVLPVIRHAAHLVVHGVLHAQGYDHEADDEAAEMEALEAEILAGLGMAPP